jgi:hypothetical protein
MMLVDRLRALDIEPGSILAPLCQRWAGPPVAPHLHRYGWGPTGGGSSPG